MEAGFDWWVGGACSVLALLAVLLAVLLLLAGCGAVKIEGECSYSRTVETVYTCTPDGKLEAIKIYPPD